jgi:predicted amidophosphoribosyltransferase
MRICPKCKKKYEGFPAISRIDDKTEICPECGRAQALLNAAVHSAVSQLPKDQLDHYFQFLIRRVLENEKGE